MNPTKVVFVYSLAFLLVGWHQAGRLAEWFDDQALSSEGLVSELAFSAAVTLREKVLTWGPGRLKIDEDRLLSLFPADLTIGARAGAPTAAPPLIPMATGLPPPDREGRPPEPRPAAPLLIDGPGPTAAAGTGASAAPDEKLLAALPRETARARTPGADSFNPARVLLLGDSMMLEGLGPQLQRELKKYEGLSVNRDGRYGTGLTRLDNFDWLAYFVQMLEKYRPDLVILTLGGNDPQDMVSPGQKRVGVGGDDWRRIYGERVADLLGRAEARGVRVFWVGLPIMGLEPYGSRVAVINQVVRAGCEAAPNCRFWDSWLTVADAQGCYSTYLPDAQGRSARVRGKDKIHLTEFGGRIMAEQFLAETADWADYRQKSEEEGPAPAVQPGEQPPLAPSAGDGRDESDLPAAGGRISERKFFSPLRNKETAYYLALPGDGSGYPGPYPVVFLLHGAWDGHDAWVKQMGDRRLAELADRFGLILVMPDGEPFGWYLDGLESAIESYLIAELMPHILSSRPEADPERVGLTGLSMGGHGALTLALKYPELFKAVGAMSAVTDLAAHAGDSHKLNRQLKIEKVLGPAGEGGGRWRPFDARRLTGARPEVLAGKPLLISAGLSDSLTLAENRAYHRLLVGLNIDHLYREVPGGHDWRFWSSQLPLHLEFMSEKLRSGKK
jgi:S-formylglutathione hydrolase FrmB